MDFAEQYIKESNLKVEVFDQINHVQQFKSMLIPAELVGARGRDRTDAYDNIKSKSQLKWNFNFPNVNKPNVKAMRAQDKFKE